MSLPDLMRALDAPDDKGLDATLGAIMSFLMANESDLVSCADAIDSDPAALAAAAARFDEAAN
ncbi:MAG: DUF3572 family protein [Sphingopyxis sp.]|nr:DUF3572 family protein [Sphingopyxis sp.]